MKLLNKLVNFPHSFYIACVLLVAFLNIFHNLSSNVIMEWDEARRGVAALEMLNSKNYFAHTYLGEIDYWSLKPPLGLWFMTLSYYVFSPSLIALRLPSALAALGCVYTTYLIGKIYFNKNTGLLSALILSTCYPFILDHSARAGEYDSLLALLVSLLVLILARYKSPYLVSILSGIIFGLVFLLKSFAVAIPIAIFCLWLIFVKKKPVFKVRHFIALFAFSSILPIVWIMGRYDIDGFKFLNLMFHEDLVNRGLNKIEGHEEGVFYYWYRILTKDLVWMSFFFVTSILLLKKKVLSITTFPLLLAISFFVPMIIATCLATKISWYINPAYPFLSLFIGWIAYMGYQQSPKLITQLFVISVVVTTMMIQRKILKRDRLPNSIAVIEEVSEQFWQASKDRRIFSSTWNQAERFTVIVKKRATPIALQDGNYNKILEKGDLLLLRDEKIKREKEFDLISKNNELVIYSKK